MKFSVAVCVLSHAFLYRGNRAVLFNSDDMNTKRLFHCTSFSHSSKVSFYVLNAYILLAIGV
jgi:hypothetical protein